MWKLVIEDDEGKRTVVPLTRDDYTIGRKEGNTIRLTERNVSRAHAKIRKLTNGATPPPTGERTHYLLEDQQSYNGVYVNGIRVAQTQELGHGDLVQIGDYRIVLQDDAVIDAQVLGPPDIERKVGLTGGHIFQGECLPPYMWSNRLTARTPMPGFYLCGACTHPGGSVIGINGRNAAMAVLSDIG